MPDLIGTLTDTEHRLVGLRVRHIPLGVSPVLDDVMYGRVLGSE
jgi:hypothetical protein